MTFRRLVLKLSFLLCMRSYAETAIGGDLVRLRPSAPPVVCNNGDLRVASNDSNALKICRANVWVSFLDTGTGLANPYSGTISTVGLQAGSLQVTAASSFTGNVTAGGSFVGNLNGSASVAGTASYSPASGTASFATASTTASVSGLADIAKISTAFSTTPTGCSAGQYAQFIAPNGNLTCAQVAFSQLSGTASIAQGGTNNGTLAVTAGGMFYSDGTKFMNMGAGSSGQGIRSAGAGTPVWRTIAPTIQTVVSGSGTYTTPANALWIMVRAVGGGGGGSGSGTASSGGSGGNGGNTTFATAVANGGQGGAANGTQGTGGTASGCTFGIGGGGGGPSSGASPAAGGDGGLSVFGGGQGGGPNDTGKAAVTNSGGGGGGAGLVAAGGAGQGGGAGAYCEILIATPAATYSYNVGTGGTAGTAGAGGAVGGVGGSGVIIVTEFY